MWRLNRRILWRSRGISFWQPLNSQHSQRELHQGGSFAFHGHNGNCSKLQFDVTHQAFSNYRMRNQFRSLETQTQVNKDLDDSDDADENPPEQDEFPSDDDMAHLGEHSSDDEEHLDIYGSEKTPFSELVEEAADKEITKPLWLRLATITGRESRVMPVIEKWLKEGNNMDRSFTIAILLGLRRMKRYHHALEVMKWVMDEKPFEVLSRDYSLYLDLYARASNIGKIEKFFNEIPEEYKNGDLYNVLLLIYARSLAVKKAEEVLEKLEEMEFLTAFSINQMIALYKRRNSTYKIQQVLEKAKSHDVKPDIWTFNLVLSCKGKLKDVNGIEKLWKEMQDKVQPNEQSYIILASVYISNGLLDKAESAVRTLEKRDFKRSMSFYDSLLRMYTRLEKLEDVERIWRTMPVKTSSSYFSLLEALSNKGEFERCEQVSKEMESLKLGWSSTLRRFNALLGAYSRKGLIEKSEALLKQMEVIGCRPDRVTGHHLAVAYVNSDNVDQALETLRIFNGNKAKPVHIRHETMLVLLEGIAKKGYIEKAEKLFSQCRSLGYSKSLPLWNALLKVYCKAGYPPYGFVQRMWADKVKPDEETKRLLSGLTVEIG